MTIGRRQCLAWGAALAATPWLRTGAPAQAHADRAVRLVLAEAAGSSNDLVARLLAPPIAASLGQAVIVENRPGGATLIGTRSVIEAPPDGHTLLVSSTSALTVASLQAFPDFSYTDLATGLAKAKAEHSQ